MQSRGRRERQGHWPHLHNPILCTHLPASSNMSTYLDFIIISVKIQSNALFAARAPPASSQSRRRPMGVFEPHIGQQPPSLRLALPRLRGRRGRRFCSQLAAWLVGWPGRYHLISHKCMESGLGIWHLRKTKTNHLRG